MPCEVFCGILCGVFCGLCFDKVSFDVPVSKLATRDAVPGDGVYLIVGRPFSFSPLSKLF